MKRTSITALILVALAVSLFGWHLLSKSTSNNGTTLEGVDSNNDGIRDDVEAAIKEHFKHSPRLQQAVRQKAKALQKALLHPENAIQIHQEASRASACQRYLFPDISFEDALWIEGVVVNNSQRSRQYIQYNANLSGRILEGHPYRIEACDFNPDQFPD